MAEQVNATLHKQGLVPRVRLFGNQEEQRVQVVIMDLEMFRADG